MATTRAETTHRLTYLASRAIEVQPHGYLLMPFVFVA